MLLPVISCITPTFNRSDLLKNAIRSTINQTYQNWEMIIVDDGSVDNTKNVINAYIQKDPRIKYFRNPGKGANTARNYGIKQSRGDYIAFLDDDAENLPHRFESQLNAAKKSGSKFILSGYKTIGRNGKETFVNKGQWVKGAGITSRWFIEKDLLFKAGLFDETMPSMQENELSYRISEYEIYANHLDIVTVENNTPNSLSKGRNALRGKEMILQKHIDKMHPLEAAWWFFIISENYYRFGEVSNALANLKKAAELDSRKVYRTGYAYAKLFLNIPLVPASVNAKILNFVCNYKYPKLVNHKLIS